MLTVSLSNPAVPDFSAPRAKLAAPRYEAADARPGFRSAFMRRFRRARTGWR